MFDWDENHDELVNSRQGQAASSAPAATARSFKPGLVVLAGLAVICAGYAGLSAWRSHGAIVDVMVAGDTALLSEMHTAPALQVKVLDSIKAQKFQTGLRGFTDVQLLGYALHAQRDHKAASEFMRPYLADAEALIGLELARRGL
ncbi:MAG: hypothetical protein JJU07_07265 [Natronohydrobacter sp.]|nr:hypothetical protein [Natronohydrobacter sp.]